MKDATAQSNTSQQLSATRSYDAFGMVVGQSGAWKGPFGYAGASGYQEDETGLQLLGHRYYDPSTGRFLTRDPIKDGRNWYVYCDNNPVTRVDPNGLEWHDPSQVIVDPRFRGRVIAYGDFSWMKRDGWRQVEVPAGSKTHPEMDVDMVCIITEDGKQHWVFLPGWSPKWDGRDVRSEYYIDEDGKVHSSAPFWLATLTWVSRWTDWVNEANNPRIGFPKGFGPRPSVQFRQVNR